MDEVFGILTSSYRGGGGRVEGGKSQSESPSFEPLDGRRQIQEASTAMTTTCRHTEIMIHLLLTHYLNEFHLLPPHSQQLRGKLKVSRSHLCRFGTSNILCPTNRASIAAIKMTLPPRSPPWRTNAEEAQAQ